MKRFIAILSLLCAAGAKGSAQDIVPELPRVYLNTAAVAAPAPGRTIIKVGSGDNLQAAIGKAQPGDVIELAKGASFTGNFILPNKNTTSTSWIVIRPSNYASLPAEGTRMTPTVAASLALPQILTPNSNHAIKTAAGAHHYRLVGLNVGVAPNVTQSYGLIGLDGEQRTEDGIPHDFIIDRMYIHGQPEVALRRCVTFNSAASAVIDSWLSECHDRGSDSQAIAGWNGPGPFKIVNNYLEGAGENIIFGGSDPAVKGLTPSDMEIRRNHLTKLLSWKKGKWLVKNIFELKHAQRVLFEGNILENSWEHGQNGGAIAIKSVNQNGSCTWCVTQDVTIRFNLIRNVGAGSNVAGAPDNKFPTGQTRRIALVDNVFANINTGEFNGDGRGFATFGTPMEVLYAHNTMMSPTNSAFIFGPAGSRVMNFSAHDNIVGGGNYGMLGDNFVGAAAFANYAPGGNFRGNVMIGPRAGVQYPAGNAYPASASEIGFDASSENYRLAPNSRFKRAGTDGRAPGANVDSLEVMIRGVRVQP